MITLTEHLYTGETEVEEDKPFSTNHKAICGEWIPTRFYIKSDTKFVSCTRCYEHPDAPMYLLKKIDLE